MDAVRTRGLVKAFGRVRALDGLDLTVAAGEVHGFLGPNGAGKSTTLRVLLGLVRADAGEVALLGVEPWTSGPDLRRRVAYVPGDVTLWPGLTGGETLDLLARLRGGVDAGRQADLVARFGLDLSRRVRAYSKGNRQKVALVAALSADVDLLVLDEPTSGLDPLVEEVFRDCVRAAAARGTGVLLSSHVLSEVEALCDRVSIVRAGRTVDTGTLAELRHLRWTSVAATVAGPVPDLAGLPGVHGLAVDGEQVRCEVDEASLGAVVARLGAADLRALTCRPPTLEDLFLRHYA